MKHCVILGLGAALAVPTRALAQQAPDGVELVRYTVRKGDTCRAIAQRTFGDSARIDLIDAHNELGPTPHHLRAGQVLMLPRRATGRSTEPDARLSFVHNLVDAFTPEEHRGQVNQPLSQGHRVSTQQASSAEVTSRDETQLQLGEHTLVVILGDTSDRTARLTASDTRLEHGTLRAHLDALAGVLPVRTPSAVATLGGGETQLHVDDARTTRLAVYRGRSRIAAVHRTVSLAAGYGSRADLGRPPSPPRLLAPAPRWTLPPARRALAPADGTTLRAEYAPGTGPGPAAAQWHVQFARDARFNDLMVDARVPATITAWETRNLPAGTYFLRVSAIDADPFEGPPSEVMRVDVAPLRTACSDAAGGARHHRRAVAGGRWAWGSLRRSSRGRSRGW